MAATWMQRFPPMSIGLATLPEHQLHPLLETYARIAAARRRTVAIGAVVLAVALVLAGWGAEVRPSTFWNQIGNFGSYWARLLRLDTGAPVWTDPAYWFWGIHRWSVQLGQTLLIAFVSTVTGAALALGGGLAASRNLVRSRILRFAAARLLEFGRTVPDLVFALIFVVAFGLGPLPGVLAIMLHTAGTLGKQFAEISETIDMRPVEGVRAAGGTWWAQVRFAVLPSVLPDLLSYALLRFEINVRGATVIGFVGAGGIGQELLTAIRNFYYADVSAMLLMLLVCVVAIDAGSSAVRHRLVSPEPGAAPVGGTMRALLAAGTAALFVASLVLLDISPVRIWQGLGQLGTVVRLMFPPDTGGHFATYAGALGQTLAIALLGTAAAGVLALPFGFLAARNVVANRLVHALARRSLDTVRSVDVLIWALIWVGVVGLGPFAGALAIASSDFGALAKLTSETVEGTPPTAADGVRASGGSRLQVLRFGVLPQVLPVFASQLLYFFESNVRSATVIGIVGAGGIGLHLVEQIRVLEWRQVLFLILMVLVTVGIIDAGSRRLRLAIVGQAA